MKSLLKLFSITTFLILFSCNDAEKEVKKYSVEDFYNSEMVWSFGFNADETKVLITSNKTGIFNAYELNLADTTTTALTNSKTNAVFGEDYVPGTTKVIFSSDDGGNENTHLYLIEKKGDKPKDLTPWANSLNSFLRWSLDKKHLYIRSSKRDSRYFDILKLDTINWSPSVVYENETAFSPSGMSYNERYVVLTNDITTDHNELYLLDQKTKKTKKISAEEKSKFSTIGFEKNDSIFYYLTNDKSEFKYVVKYNIHSEKSEILYKDNWDVESMWLSKNEKYRVITTNKDGKNNVMLFDHATGKQLKMPEIKNGNVTNVAVSHTETKLLLIANSSTSPNNLYVFDIEKNELKQLTSTLNKKINQDDLVEAEVIRYKSFDGLEIPALFYKPKQASKSNKVPAVVWVHGGPGDQSRIGYSTTIQYLVNQGYAILEVNNRGSSGYGKTFHRMDNKDHGNGDLKDCVWGKKWLASQDYIDQDAIGINGGSYGGFLVLSAMAFYPDEFQAGVNVFGVTDWMRTLKSIPPFLESFKSALYEEMGNPFTADSIRLKQISPMNNYHKITKPLLVLQGVNDVRVLKIESDEIVEGVKKNGVPVEYILFPDEGHGFMKTENQIKETVSTLAFYDKYLKKKS
ncbi:S9 family peptidase [Flavobacterium azooxidireducens]|uniref:S9 family peptidase n=1 Tax=Flavobacterium azooxidireducens TaxID=1871076 RepID=A0ABY4KAX3_9FLAO|nr:S9 family peptidase [Flavobacterium azooxidireducens]UPQ77714.1 S9 family peptidase [Flavobacterium azooxidireducens]